MPDLLLDGCADVDALIAASLQAWRPPRRMSLSQWADENYVLPAESAAEPGRWKTLPYQRAILDAITDPRVERVTWMKSARVGYTMCMSAAVAYFMAHDPCSILLVQPTVDDAKGFSKDTIAPMLRDVPALAKIAFRDLDEKGPKDSSNTLTRKAFPGGALSLVGANSGTGLRRKGCRVAALDEVDAYPPSAGSDGDPVRLAIMRTQTFWNRKIIAGSTPLVAGTSRIAEMFEAGDRRRYYVPCPHCGHMDVFTFREKDARGHFMKWPEGRPEEAYFVCRQNGCIIEHHHKRDMVERGEWRADAPFAGHASFHIWSAYSYSPNATWGQLAKEWVEASKAGSEALRTCVNTLLGETWQEIGEAPDWLRLYQRREPYPIATVPAPVMLLTAGVDVQRDRLVWEVVGWGEDRQSWSIDAAVIPGDTSKPEPWAALDELLGRAWPCADGSAMTIRMLAVDAGFNTQEVYNWARRHPMSRVVACKGVSTARTLIGAPSAVDVKASGKRLARGYKVWPVGVDLAKAELYGWLRLDAPTKESGAPFPPGYCHHPEYGEEYFKQLTAEQLVRTVGRQGFAHYEWQLTPGRENHWLDCRVYARAAAALLGLDRHAASIRVQPAPAPAAISAPSPRPEPSAERPASTGAPAKRGGWLGGGSGGTGRGGGGWLSRRR